MSHGTGVPWSHTLQPHQRLYQLKQGIDGTNVKLGNTATNSCHTRVLIAFICSREQTPALSLRLAQTWVLGFPRCDTTQQLVALKDKWSISLPSICGVSPPSLALSISSNPHREKVSSLMCQETNSRRKTKPAKQDAQSTRGNTQSTLRFFSSSFKLLHSVSFLTHSHHVCQMLY